MAGVKRIGATHAGVATGYEAELWRMADASRGIEGQVGHGDRFHHDSRPDLKTDFILANPPFDTSDWGGERLTDDKRWHYGVPPKGNANFAWVQHIHHHPQPAGAAEFTAHAKALADKNEEANDD